MQIRSFQISFLHKLQVLAFLFGALSSPALSAPCAELDTGFELGIDPNESGLGVFEFFRIEDMSGEIAKRALPLVIRSYEKIGGSVYQTPESLTNDLDFAMTSERNGRMVAFAGGWFTAAGKKITVLASDGSAYGTNTIKLLIRELAEAKIPSTFAELSGAPLSIAAKSGEKLRIIPFDTAQRILEGWGIYQPTPADLQHAVESREIPNDERLKQSAYSRKIPNVGVHTKVMAGSPLVKFFSDIVP